MRSWTAAQAYDTDYVTPFPVNDEFLEMGGVVHSLDVWNFPAGSLTVNKVATGAYGDIRIVASAFIVDVNISDAAGQADLFSVPDGAGNPWIETFTSGEGVLSLSFGAVLTNISTLTTAPFWVGLRVDGVLVAQTGTYRALVFGSWVNSFSLFANVPVGAGAHTIEPVWGLYGVNWALTTVEFFARVLTIREVAR